jgi:hypothetical protein
MKRQRLEPKLGRRVAGIDVDVPRFAEVAAVEIEAVRGLRVTPLAFVIQLTAPALQAMT